jgi:hypothetical protein
VTHLEINLEGGGFFLLLLLSLASPPLILLPQIRRRGFEGLH